MDRNEAIKVIKDNWPYGRHQLSEALITLFPELKESEDERIRKELISLIKETHVTDRFYDLNKMIAWLEKQGEQKITNTPKFKAGDWIISDSGFTFQILKIENECYIADDGDNVRIKLIDKHYHLWTIKDAKDGDILEFGDHGRLVVGIVSYVNKTTGKTDVSCLLENNNFKVGNYYNLDTIKPHPATKEQRDRLFQKMKDAGYEWDAEKKELKKIGQNPTWSEDDAELTDFESALFSAFSDAWQEYLRGEEVNVAKWAKAHSAELLKAAIEQKPWSEEDEKIINSIIKNLDEGEWFDIYQADWLKSLKERIQSQPKQELNEETVNEYINLGLPSGTLWKTFNEDGYYKFDEAVEKFGDKLPTKEQCEELKNECKWEWKVNGYCVTGPNSKSIFLPAAGYHTGNSVYCVGALGGYWSYNKDGAWSVDFDSDDVDMHPRGIYNHGFSVRLVK